MSRFGQYLVERKLLVEAQLEEAMQHQIVYGARLGTNLVELQMLSIEQLAECLADFHRVALPPKGWLERPKRAAIERVTRPLVERIRFIPMRLETNILHAAVLDPNDPRTLDDLRFATGCKIQPYVLPEIWMHDWLFTLFKVPRGIRHVDTGAEPRVELAGAVDAQATQAAATQAAVLAAKAARVMMPATVGVVAPVERRQSPAPPAARRSLGPTRESLPSSARERASGIAPAPASGASMRPAVAVRSLAELGAGRSSLVGTPAANAVTPVPVEPRPSPPPRGAELHPDWGADTGRIVPLPLASESSPVSIVSDGSPAAAPAELKPKELSELENALRQVTDREQLLDLSFSIATRFARLVGLFIVQHGMVQGVRCIEGGEMRTINGVLVPLESSSMLALAASQLVPFRADPRERPLDVRLQRLLSEQSASEVSLFPVTVKQRVVNLLYASHGAEPLGAIAFGALAILAEQMGAAYGQLILQRKTASMSP